MAIDLAFILLAGYGFYTGYYKGIIQTIFSAVSVIFGLLIAFKLSAATTRMLETTFESNHPMMFPAGFALTFLTALLLFRLISKGLEGVVQTVHLNAINRIAGGAVLAGGITLLLSVLLWFGDTAGLLGERLKNESQTYPFLQTIPDKARNVAMIGKPIFMDFWEKSSSTLDRFQHLNNASANPDIYNLNDERQAARQKNSSRR